MTWLPIRYRDFYDMPRVFLVEHGGSLYLFDCPFDDRADEYATHFQIYELTTSTALADDDGLWQNPSAFGTLVGTVGTSFVPFDSTRRLAIDDRVFQHSLRR